jgi:hypothetical protein
MLPQRETRSKHTEKCFVLHLQVACELTGAQLVQDVTLNSTPINFVRYVTFYVNHDYSCDCDAR